MITRVLLGILLLWSAGSTYLAVRYHQLYTTQRNAVVEALVLPDTGDVLVRVNRDRIYGFADLCKSEEFF